MKTKKANQKKKRSQATFSSPWEDPQKMAEMMESCCQGERAIDCCSMMGSMMEHCAGPWSKKPRKTPPEGKQNG